MLFRLSGTDRACLQIVRRQADAGSQQLFRTLSLSKGAAQRAGLPTVLHLAQQTGWKPV